MSKLNRIGNIYYDYNGRLLTSSNFAKANLQRELKLKKWMISSVNPMLKELKSNHLYVYVHDKMIGNHNRG